MTREDIIRMAREAGFDDFFCRDLMLERFAALVIAHREAQSIHSCGPDCQKPLCVNRRREIAAAVEAEREVILAHCEAVCKAQAAYGPPPCWMQLIGFIRARGSK